MSNNNSICKRELEERGEYTKHSYRILIFIPAGSLHFPEETKKSNSPEKMVIVDDNGVPCRWNCVSIIKLWIPNTPWGVHSGYLGPPDKCNRQFRSGLAAFLALLFMLVSCPSFDFHLHLGPLPCYPSFPFALFNPSRPSPLYTPFPSPPPWLSSFLTLPPFLFSK